MSEKKLILEKRTFRLNHLPGKSSSTNKDDIQDTGVSPG